MINAVWGLKTDTIFDVWLVGYILCGFSVGKIVLETDHRVSISNRCFGLILAACKKTISILLAFYFWETIEHYLETGLVGNVVSYWFQGVEF